MPLKAIRNTVGPSPIPNQTMARGTQAMMGTCRRELMKGDRVCKVFGKKPISMPKG